MPLNTFCGIGAGAHGTGGTQTVVLAVSALTHTAEAVTLHYALVAFTFGGADDVDIATFFGRSPQ